MGENISHPQSSGYKLIPQVFMNHDICGGAASSVIHVTYNNVVVISIKSLLATIDRSSIITTIQRKSMTVNGGW